MSNQNVVTSHSPVMNVPTYQQAYSLVPKAWYESDWISNSIYLLIGFPTLAFLWWKYYLNPPLFLSVIGLSMYLVGLGFDIVSTHQTSSMAKEFERRNIPFPLVETNPLIKDVPTLRDQVFNWSNVFHIGTAVIAWIVPAIGIMRGLAHARAALNNRRHKKRLIAQLSLVD